MDASSTEFKAVILAGGSGERFWPLSTPERPKQFLNVFGGDSLIRQSVARLAGLVRPERTYVVTAAALVGQTRRELPQLPPGNIVGEPMRRDTGAAVALAAGLCGDGVMGVFPSDQLVTDPVRFRAALEQAVGAALVRETIVTLGIRPTGPSTAFGYVDPATGRFVEKPDAATAAEYVARGYLWNAGMFVGRTETFRRAFAAHAPALSALADPADRAALAGDLTDLYASLPRISFDYAVMEKLPSVAVVPGDFGWDDVGGYGAFDRHYPHDGAGNVLSGDARQLDSGDSILVARGAKIAALGVRGLVVVTTPDAVLVADKSRVGDLKKLLAR